MKGLDQEAFLNIYDNYLFQLRYLIRVVDFNVSTASYSKVAFKFLKLLIKGLDKEFCPFGAFFLRDDICVCLRNDAGKHFKRFFHFDSC